jgi:energy-coupling factor transport system ATP-binding protein
VIGIQLEGLTHIYPGGVRALDGLGLDIGPGEAVALVGQNGSGKTTLIRHLNGLLRPTAGRVVVGGVDAAGLRVAQLARQVGLAFQDPDRQIFAGSVRKEVEFGPRNVGLRGAALEEAVGSALAAVGLGDEAETNPYDLGASRRRLLAIASVLAMRTPVLVLDEPTSGQDGHGIGLVRDLVAAVTAEGRTVVVVSHDLRFVAETFPRVVVLRAGRVVFDAPPAEAFARPAWETLRSTGLEPPAAAVLAERLGLGPVASEAALIGALAAGKGSAGQGASGGG